MKKLVFLMIILCVFSLGAQEAFVLYTEGDIEVYYDGEWDTLNIGDTVDSTESVRLSVGAYLELDVEGSRIMISQSGEYELENVLARSSNSASAGIGDMVAGKVSRLLTEDERDKTVAVGGVRASEAVEFSLEWADDLTMAFDNVKLAIREEKYDLAESTLNWLDDEVGFEYEVNELHYLYGYLNYLQGNLREALDYFEDTEVSYTDDYFEDYTLVLASLYISSFAYDKAFDLLQAVSSFTEDSDIQEAYFLLGVVLYEKGDIEAAAENWENALEYDGEMNETIESMLSTL